MVDMEERSRTAEIDARVLRPCVNFLFTCHQNLQEALHLFHQGHNAHMRGGDYAPNNIQPWTVQHHTFKACLRRARKLIHATAKYLVLPIVEIDVHFKEPANELFDMVIVGIDPALDASAQKQRSRKARLATAYKDDFIEGDGVFLDQEDYIERMGEDIVRASLNASLNEDGTMVGFFTIEPIDWMRLEPAVNGAAENNISRGMMETRAKRGFSLLGQSPERSSRLMELTRQR